MKIYENKTFAEERALYGESNVFLKRCRIDGELDGESALKESCHVKVEDCFFNLRYPLWHCYDAEILNCVMTESCRAPLWYSSDVNIIASRLSCPKAVRECRAVTVSDSEISSAEFGWFSSDIKARSSSFIGEYFMLRSKRIDFSGIDFRGKYSFQYIEDSVFENCNFDTKDAFWHAKNVTVRDSTVKGEYLGWYSENLTLENCTVIGTQPLCYCKNLTLINCRMPDTDLAFEKSSVRADISGGIDSIKNPLSGYIRADGFGEIIYDTDEKLCEITVKSGCHN